MSVFLKSMFILSLMIGISAHAQQSLPKISCTVVQAAGDMSTFLQPEVGDQLTLDLNNPAGIVSGDRIAFESGHYISMNDMPQLSLEIIKPASHDSGGMRLQSVQSHPFLGVRTVKIEVLGHLQAKTLDAWITNEHNNPTYPTLGRLGLHCSNVTLN